MGPKIWRACRQSRKLSILEICPPTIFCILTQIEDQFPRGSQSINLQALLHWPWAWHVSWLGPPMTYKSAQTKFYWTNLTTKVGTREGNFHMVHRQTMLWSLQGSRWQRPTGSESMGCSSHGAESWPIAERSIPKKSHFEMKVIWAL